MPRGGGAGEVYGLGQASPRIRLRFRLCLAENTAGMESLAAGLMTAFAVQNKCIGAELRGGCWGGRAVEALGGLEGERGPWWGS